MLLKNKIFLIIGGSVEWFDFALYGFLGPIFSEIFFSHTHRGQWAALLITYSIFAIGFAARPIGGLIFGHFGDKYGRIAILKITPLLMMFFTALIAFLPTYKAAGDVAIALLILTRFLQGILLGGEYAGNIVYLCESSSKWKYFWGSVASCSGSFGIILASIITSAFYFIFSHSFMNEYGWRIAFLCSIPLGVVSFFTRLKMLESNEFLVNSPHKSPICKVFKYHKGLLFLCIGLIYLHATSFYFVFIFLPIFLEKFRHLAASASLLQNTMFLLIHLILIPVFGFIVNLWGGLRSQVAVLLLFIFLSVPIFYLIAYGTERSIFIGTLTLSVMTAINAAIIPGLLSTLVPTKVRYTILALSLNIGFGVLGGITPLISLFFIHKGGKLLLPGVYLAAAALITLIVSCAARKHEKPYEARKLSIS